MSYKVIKEFHDLTDFSTTKSGTIYHHYEVGDEFPRKGAEASEERINELLSDENALGAPLIREVKQRRNKKRQEPKENE